MLKLNRMIAVVVLTFSIVGSMPALARADQHGEASGPMPIAALGSLVGGVFWIASLPFAALVSPRHIGDGFDLLVAAPMRVATGAAEPEPSRSATDW